MKANRKFIEADERAVSAVIGVILMVAITVAIAATVYVYVSGMIKVTMDVAPTGWCIYTSSGVSIGYNQATTQPFTGVQLVNAGDYLLLNGTVGNVKVTLAYSPTNSLLGSWTINV